MEMHARAVKLVKKLYNTQGGEAGGRLHIVTDDWNLEPAHINFCLEIIEDAIEEGVKGVLIRTEKELVDIFKDMTEDQIVEVLREVQG